MKALITGASSGIGRDMSKELAKRGYDLILVARDNKKLEKVSEEIKSSYKVKVKTIQKDLAEKQNCIEVYNKVKSEDIDILINNAGFGVHGLIIETDFEKEINMLETNIVAVHILMKLFLQDMVKKNKGKILNVSSMAAFSPGPLMAGYYSSKAYVYRLSECVKTELKTMKSNVKISVLCPGPVRTNFNKEANVNFAAPSLSSDVVAKYAIKKMLKGKFTIVPGNLMKITRLFEKILPHNWISYVSYLVNYRKKEN